MSSTPFCCPARSRVTGRLPRQIGEGGLRLLLLLTFVSALPAFGHAQAPVQTVPAVDLPRYLGDWFEVARLPNRFQTECVAHVRATYVQRTDGRLDVINRCDTANGDTIQAQGLAIVADAKTFAKLKVRFAPAFLSFLPMVWGDYWILGLARDYSWAVVGSPDRKYLWILSRTPVLPAPSYGEAVTVAGKNGFAVNQLIRTRHDLPGPRRRPAPTE